MKKIVMEAISDLPDKDYVKDLVDKIEIKVNKLIEAEIQKTVKPLVNKLEICERKIAVYEAHFQGLEKRMEKYEEKLDDAEQYSRRSCIRIFGIPLSSGSESSDDCIAKVKKVFEEIEVDVPEDEIDRAHRIGKKYREDGKNEQAMIVKFTSWKYRTAVYRARKKANKKYIQLDLTSRRAGLLKDAKKKAEGHENIDFIFVDVNCRLGLKKLDGTFKYFNNVSELESILNDDELPAEESE